MKRVLFLLTLFALFAASIWAQNPSDIINAALKNSVEQKISEMQQLIGFNDEQAQQLKTAEYAYLLDVRKAEKCFLCNKKKRVEKLSQNRDAALQKILTREQYIKYEDGDVEAIKAYPVRVK